MKCATTKDAPGCCGAVTLAKSITVPYAARQERRLRAAAVASHPPARPPIARGAACSRSNPVAPAFGYNISPGIGHTVNFKELLDSWRDGAAAPRTARTYSVRLPVDDAARLGALAEMFPGRTAEQLISELLAAALTEMAAAMPYVAGAKIISTDEQGDPVYEDTGPMPRFLELTRKHRRALAARPKKKSR